MIAISNLNFRYSENDSFALENVSFEFRPGEVIGVLGHNGAGKSTLIKLICGLLPISPLSFSHNGSAVSCERSEILHTLKMGFAPDISELDPELTAQDMLELVGALRGLKPDEIAQEIAHFIEVFQMKEWFQNTLASHYSLGMKKKVSLAIALFGPIQYAVLDEPFNGLDPVVSYQFKKLLLEKRDQECGILVSSHLLEIIENFITRVLILNQGEPIFNDSLEVLRKNHPQCNSLEEIYYHLHRDNK